MNVLHVIICLTTFLCYETANCEQYTSVDELSGWSRETIKFTDKLDELINLREYTLSELKRIRDTLLPFRKLVRSGTLIDPVHIFVILNRLHMSVDDIEKLPKDDWIYDTSEYDGDSRIKDTAPQYALEEFKKRIEEDLNGSGKALLRLQAFYGLNITQLISGSITPSGSSPSKMNANDCFRLGRIAYLDGQYNPAIVWLYASLELIKDANESKAASDNNQLIDDILDHMAFAAYKLGLLDYSIKLTRAWLNRDPENERAKENLEYYLDELDSRTKEVSPSTDAPQSANSIQNFSHDEYFKKFQKISLDSYLVEDDEVVRRLCRQSEIDMNSSNRCHSGPATFVGGYLYPGIKIETLNEDPKIIRIYDIISPNEAEYLRSKARPKLERSTIMLSNRQQPSDFRIAKTAWLRGDTDQIVKRIEDRLAFILDIGMEKSELLQVVNYGLGGFYGPHLDTARSSKRDGNESLLLSQLERSDRLATILVYLNDVQLGGSTVFPLLNLTVAPIARSAIVWFNILETGYADERTLHTGCPVSSGSKWVAVKWPREDANIFPKKRRWWYDMA